MLRDVKSSVVVIVLCTLLLGLWLPALFPGFEPLMLRDVKSSVVVIVLCTLLLGLGLLALFTGFAQLAFAHQADGSLVKVDGRTVGSRLVAQAFTRPQYFHERPSGTSPEYNASGT